MSKSTPSIESVSLKAELVRKAVFRIYGCKQLPELIARYNFLSDNHAVFLNDGFFFKYEHFFSELYKLKQEHKENETFELMVELHKTTRNKKNQLIAFVLIVKNKIDHDAKFQQKILYIRRKYGLPDNGIEMDTDTWDKEPFAEGSPVNTFFHAQTQKGIDDLLNVLNTWNRDLTFFSTAQGMSAILDPLFHLHTETRELVKDLLKVPLIWEKTILIYVLTNRWMTGFIPFESAALKKLPKQYEPTPNHYLERYLKRRDDSHSVLSFEDIAVRLGIKSSAVRKIAQRARKKR